VTYVSDVMAIVSWETDEFSDSVVRFGGSSGTYNRIATATQMSMHHAVVLTNLASDTRYYFVAYSTDPSGNVSERSEEKSFSTEKKADTTAPRIKGVQINPGSDTATINWDTDELAAGKILFGTHSGMYNNQMYEGILGAEHSLTLLGLLGSTTYYFQIVETDPSGNQSQSKEYSFRTGTYDPGHGGGDDGHGGRGHHGNNDDDNGNNNDNHGGGNDNHGRGEGY
jgi:chitodextrinase